MSSTHTTLAASNPSLLIIGDLDNLQTALTQTLISYSPTPISYPQFINLPLPPTYPFIVFIDNHHHSTQALTHLLDHSSPTTKLLYLTQPPLPDSPLYQISTHHLSLLTHYPHLDLRVVNLYHLFGPGVISPHHYNLSSIFTHLPQLPTPVGHLFPLYLETAGHILPRALFGSNSKAKIFELAGATLSAETLIHHLSSQLNSQSLTTTSTAPLLLPHHLLPQLTLTNKELWLTPTPITTHQLQTSLSFYLSQPTASTTSPTPIPTPPVSQDPAPQPRKQLQLGSPPRNKSTRQRSSTFTNLKRFFTIFILTILFTIFLTTIQLARLSINLSSLFTTIHSHQLPDQTTINQLNRNLNSLQPLVTLISYSASLHPSIGEGITYFEFLTNTRDFLLDLNHTQTQATSLAASLAASQPTTIDSWSQLASSANRLYHTTSLLQAQLNHLQTLSLTSKLGLTPSLASAGQLLAQSTPQLEAIQSLLSQAPSLLGYDRPKDYLVLLQNSAELRPTGGFIGSFAILNFNQGKLADIYVEDVYAADGQLKGHVEPPPALKQYLGEAGWFLRDSNWDPDFATSAQRAAWFLEKTLNRQVDGVIGLNLLVIKQLLTVTGPIELADYQETITADNLFSRTQYHVEINQFPGSTQKRDFLSSLSNQLFLKLANLDSLQAYQLGLTLYDLLESNQITLYHNQSSVQTVFKQLSWAGELVQLPCPTSSCTSDYLYFNEANVGVNKANYFVTRTADITTTLTPDNSITHQLTLKYANSSPSDNWPGGPYRNYLRLYLPPGSQPTSFSIDGQPQSISKLNLNPEEHHQVIATLVVVPPLETSTIQITYTTPITIDTSKPSTYHLTVQHQPGTESTPISHQLHNQSSSLTTSSTLSTQTNLNRDLGFQIEFDPVL